MLKDPASAAAMWAFLGVFTTAFSAILIELIRTRRKTEDVKQEVINGNNTASSDLDELKRDIKTVKERLDGHIHWHLERDGQYVYLRR